MDCKRQTENEGPPPLRRHVDKYDNLGRNISEQERRQERVMWIRVKYGKK